MTPPPLIAERLLFGLLAAAFLLSIGLAWHRKPAWRWLRLALLAAAATPLLVASANWADLLAGDWLRFERQWLSWVPSAAGVWLWVTTARFRPEDRSLYRTLRDASLITAAICAGLAVAGTTFGTPLDRMAVVVAIDRSRSVELVPNAERRIELELQAARTSMRPNDLLGYLEFGGNAIIQSPPLPRHLAPPPSQIPVIRDATDLEGALRRALAELPADAAGRIVLISDGVATRGEASNGAAAIAAAGIELDVVPLDQETIRNVRLLRLSAPPTVSEGETFELRVVIDSPTATSLELRQLEDGQLVQQGPVDVQAGQNLFSLRQIATRPGLHRVQVELSTDEPALDEIPEDNQLATFIRVRGRTHALVLSSRGANTALATALEAAGMRVGQSQAQTAPMTVSEFAGYDLVVLQDLPARRFSRGQLEALAAFVRVAGGGLLLLGSHETLGPGGYSRTPIESVSPVAFDLKQDRRRGQLSQVIAIDYSGSMAAHTGGRTKLDLANEGAVRSLNLLGTADRLGVMHVDTEPRWTVELDAISNKRQIAEAIRAVGPGGGGILVDPALRQAYAALGAEPSALKHVLLFADGSDAKQMSQSAALADAAANRAITTSVVALGRGDDLAGLERLSRAGKGRFYVVDDPSRIPAVFAQETITAARSAVHEEPFRAEGQSGSGVLRGLNVSLAPELNGYVVTLPRARAQVLLRGPDSDPLLATWSAGLGRVAVFTSDYGGSWGEAWARWPGAAQLFAQLARSLARNQDDSQVRLELTHRDGQLQISVDALDSTGSLDSFRSLEALVAGPDGEVQTLALRASGPGRYTAAWPLHRSGATLVSVQDSLSETLLATAGVESSSSDELKPTGTDRIALRGLAEASGGRMRDTLAGIFEDRPRARFAHVDVTGILAACTAVLLLLTVAARRLPAPSWMRARAWPAPANAVTSHKEAPPRPARAALDEPPVSGPGNAAREPDVTTAEVLLARRRRNRQRGGREV